LTLFFSNIKQYSIDKKNRKLFVQEIQKEIENPSSQFNKLKLNCDEGLNNISWLIVVPENYQLAGTDAMIYNKLKEDSYPVLNYLSKDLNWGEYLLSPEFYHIEDNDDDEAVSCTYLARCQYQPVLNKYPNFKWEFITFVGLNCLLLGSLITLLCVL